MTLEVMEYMVWVIEVTASELFGGDKTAAYRSLKESGLWDIYTVNYETTHALGREFLIDEITAYFIEHGIKIS